MTASSQDTVDTSCCAGKITYGCHKCYKLNAAKEAQCCAKTALGWGDVPTCECKPFYKVNNFSIVIVIS